MAPVLKLLNLGFLLTASLYLSQCVRISEDATRKQEKAIIFSVQSAAKNYQNQVL